MRFKIQEIQNTSKTDYNYSTNLEWCKVGVLIDTKTGNKWDVNELARKDNFLTIHKIAWYIYSCSTSANCYNCISCYECKKCNTCTSCHRCYSCQNCDGCRDAVYSNYCTDCTSVEFSNFSYNYKQAR